MRSKLITIIYVNHPTPEHTHEAEINNTIESKVYTPKPYQLSKPIESSVQQLNLPLFVAEIVTL